MGKTQQQGFRPGMLAVWGLMVIVFAGSVIHERLQMHVVGTVVASQVHCVQPQNNRCVTHYTLLSETGALFTHDAGPNDQSLPRELPVGTRIDKPKWSIGYRINGADPAGGMLVPYWMMIPVGLALIASSFWLHRRPE